MIALLDATDLKENFYVKLLKEMMKKKNME